MLNYSGLKLYLMKKQYAIKSLSRGLYLRKMSINPDHKDSSNYTSKIDLAVKWDDISGPEEWIEQILPVDYYTIITIYKPKKR